MISTFGQRLRSIFTTPAAIATVSVFIWSCFSVTRAVNDPDYGWHLRAGQIILDQHRLITYDPFSYSNHNFWTMHEWGSEVIYALLANWRGIGAIVITFSLITWLGLLCIVLRTRMRNSNALALAIGMYLSIQAAVLLWGARPQIITFSFTCLLMLLIDRHRLGKSGVWWSVPLVILWANLHGGFIIAPILIFIAFAGETVAISRSQDRITVPERVSTLGYVLAAVLLAGLVNPYGLGLYKYALQIQNSSTLRKYIFEWQSPNLLSQDFWGFTALLAILLISTAITRRINFVDLLMVVMSGFLALSARRNILLFIAVATPIWIEQLSLAGQLTFSKLHRLVLLKERLSNMRQSIWVISGVAVISILSWTLGARVVAAATLSDTAAPYATVYPVCATKWLATQPGNLRIFAEYTEAGYLIEYLSQRSDKVYVFGDVLLMGDTPVSNWVSVTRAYPGWPQILAATNSDIVLVDQSDAVTPLLKKNPDWLEVYSDQLDAVFAKRDDKQITAQSMAQRCP